MIRLVDEERCVGCTLCVKVCPMDVFRMTSSEGKKAKAYIAYPEDCMSCFICEEYCPADCLYVDPSRSPLHAVWPWPEDLLSLPGRQDDAVVARDGPVREAAAGSMFPQMERVTESR